MATDYHGNYSHYLAESAKRRAEQKAAYDRQQKYIARQTAFINATKANAARAAMAKSREKALAKLRAPARSASPSLPRITVKLATGKRSPDRVLTAEGINKSFGDNQVLRGLSLAVGRGDRIALVGAERLGQIDAAAHAGRSRQAGPRQSRARRGRRRRLLRPGPVANAGRDAHRGRRGPGARARAAGASSRCAVCWRASCSPRTTCSS